MPSDKQRQSLPSQWWLKLVKHRIISFLVAILLFLAVCYLASLVPWLFRPIQQFFSIIGFPVILAAVFYYLMNPLVDLLEKRWQIKRTWSIVGLFVIIGGLIVLGIAVLIPVIREQTMSLLTDWPKYWNQVVNEVTRLSNDPQFGQVRTYVDNLNTDAVKSISSKVSSYLGGTVSSLSGVLGTVTTVVIGLVTMPFILFYLLRDGRQLPGYMAKFVPNKWRPVFRRVLGEMNQQVSNYIRGQLTVAFFVALMFYIGYLIIGLKYALTIGIAAGILNLIPYLGSFLAMIPSIVIGAFVSPWMLVKVIIVFIIEQTIEGRVISPLVLGSSLAIHPVTILVVLLASGKIFGLVGVIFGIPGYAILKVIITHLFDWYTRHSGLYHDD